MVDHLILALGASGAALAAWALLRRRQRQQVVDYQAAFPTAQWVAAMRMVDAESGTPKIGSNIGAGPDTLARTLTGNAGLRILDDCCKHYNCDKQVISQDLVARTLTFDKRWMDALDAGCKQFVILAAGLDGRAWRLPGMDKTVTVFEVDVPNAHAFKSAQIAAAGEVPPLPCRRVAVEADLSESGWPEKLRAEGFDPAQRSFFLVEGLLMYLPHGAPELLLQRVRALMAPGSVLTGDSFVSYLGFVDQAFVHSLGTKWTFDLASEDAVHALLGGACGLKDVSVQRVGHEPEANGDAFVAAKAARLQQILLSMGAWPAAAVDATLPRLLSGGEAAVTKLVEQITDDKANFHGLKDTDAHLKVRIVEAVLRMPLAEPKHGSADLSTALQATARELAQSRAPRSLLRRWYDMAVFVGQMAKRGSSKTPRYVTFVGTA